MRCISILSIAGLALPLTVSPAAFAQQIQPVQAISSKIAIAPRTPVQQALTAEVVVVGKVLEIEKEATKATATPGAADKVDYQIAVVKINESVQGAKGLTNLRIGFQSVAAPAPVNLPPNGIRITRPYPRSIVLTEGQEGCFFLVKHHEGDFYILQQGGQPLDKKAADFDKQLDSVKKLMKVIEDPKASLKAKETSDRQFAAVMLVQKYRQIPQVTTPNAKMVPEAIDAEESKLILSTLADMEWGKVDPNGTSLQSAFYSLGLQAKDGWTQPKFVQGKDFNKIMGGAVAKWLKANADKYRIQRQVVAK